MKGNRWIYPLVFVVLALAGGLLWWQGRRRPERITLSDLPSLQPRQAQRLAEASRRDGRASSTAVSLDLRQ